MWKSIFGTRPEKNQSKPNKIHVPPKVEEEKPPEESKPVEEPSSSPEKPELNSLDSNEFFNNLKSDPVKSNEYNPPNLFAGMSLGTSTTSKPTSVFGTGLPPNQTPNIPMQLNTNSPGTQSSLFGMNIQTTPNSVFSNNSTNLFGVPITNQSQSSDKKSIFQETQNQTNLNKSIDFNSNMKDSSLFSFEGMKITQPDNVNKSMILNEGKGEVDKTKSSDYAPPNLFEWLSSPPPSDPKAVNKLEITETQNQATSSASGKFWDSYKKTGNQQDVAKTASHTSQVKATEKIKNSTVTPHTPDNKTIQTKDKMFGKSDADISCSPIHNVSKHSINDEDKDISLSKDKNNDESDDDVLIDQKHPIKVDSDDEKKPSKPYRLKLSTDSSIEEAKQYISTRICTHQREVECIVENQIQKLKLIKDKRTQEEKLISSIKEKDAKLSEASKAEEYELADKLQNEITKEMNKIESIHKHMISLEKQKADLELKIREVEETFIKSLKEDVSILIEIESKHSTEKNIFKKTEENKIDDVKISLKSREIRIHETEKEIDK